MISEQVNCSLDYLKFGLGQFCYQSEDPKREHIDVANISLGLKTELEMYI